MRRGRARCPSPGATSAIRATTSSRRSWGRTASSSRSRTRSGRRSSAPTRRASRPSSTSSPTTRRARRPCGSRPTRRRRWGAPKWPPKPPNARGAPAEPWHPSITRQAPLWAGERLDRGDPVGGARMGREEAAAAAAARRAHEPAERVGHQLPAVVPGALQELDTVLVGGVFLVARVLAQEELAGDRREVAAAGDDLVEKDHADVQARAERLRLLHVVEVLVRQLVRENGAQLVVVGLLQQARGHEELAVAGAGRVDGGVVHHADLHLAG